MSTRGEELSTMEKLVRTGRRFVDDETVGEVLGGEPFAGSHTFTVFRGGTPVGHLTAQSAEGVTGGSTKFAKFFGRTFQR